MIKRITVVVLVLLMILAAPLPCFAEEVEDPMEPTEETTETIEITEEEENTDTAITLQNILVYLTACTDYLRVVTGCVVFQVVAVLCFFVYKFFRIFF